MLSILSRLKFYCLVGVNSSTSVFSVELDWMTRRGLVLSEAADFECSLNLQMNII